MKLRTVAIVAAMLLTVFTGCGVWPAAPGPTSPSTTKPDFLPKPTQLDRRSVGGFAIYLLVPNALAHGFTDIGPADLEGDPLLTIDDIVSYRSATHEIELTDAAYERIRNVAIPLQGEGFAVCIDKQPIYAGAIWNAYSSSVFEGSTIDLVRPTRERPVLQIRLGYPTSAFFRGEDRRSDPRIFQALQEVGKLR